MRVSQNHLWMFSGGGPMHCGAIAIYAKKNNAPMRDACVAKPFVNV